MNLETQIYEYIKNNKGTNFAELSKLKGFSDERGAAFGMSDKNIMFWTNISEEAMQALKSLMKKDKLYYKNCTPMPYIADGFTLRYPIAKQTERFYTKIHWAPILLYIKE